MSDFEETKVKVRKGISRTFSSILEWLNYLPGMDLIKVTPMKIASDKLPASMEGLRVVFLSDLHSHRFGKKQERLERVVRYLKPDLILVAGDWVRIEYEGKDRQAVKDAAEVLAGIAPTYTNLGNHEAVTFWEDQNQELDDLREKGVHVLDNETIAFTKPGSRTEDIAMPGSHSEECIYISGLTTGYTYFRSGARKTRRETLQQLKTKWQETLDQVPQDAYRIAIAHRPELLKMYASIGADLVLCGHAHGGLMKLGRNLRLLAPDQGIFPAYTHGRHKEGQTEMIISEGLGGPRIGISPEVILMTFHREDNEADNG